MQPHCSAARPRDAAPERIWNCAPENPPGAEVLYGPLQIGRKHVDIAPILAVLAVFEHGDIQIRKLACDVGEMGIVPAVAAEENPLRRSFDDERSPQRPVRPKRTSGKVPRGTAIYRKAAAERSLFAPIELRDPLRIETPIFEILAHTQRADDTARAVAQLRYRAVVEMVPMVVCDDQQVDPRHILGFIEIGPLEGLLKNGKGEAVSKTGSTRIRSPSA